MYKNYFLTAIRNFIRNKSFSIINIVGLSVGITASILIYLFISHELSFDKHLKNYKHLFRAADMQHKANSGETEYSAYTSFLLGPTLREKMTGLDAVSRVINWSNRALSIDKEKVQMNDMLFVEKDFFHMMDIVVLQGSVGEVNSPSDIYLSQKTAHKLFGKENPLGKEIEIDGKYKFNVAAILEDAPELTNYPFTCILSTEAYPVNDANFDIATWGTTLSGFETLVQLKPNVKTEHINKQFTNILQSLFDSGDLTKKEYFVQAFSDIRTDANLGRCNSNGYTKSYYLIIFGIIGIFILILACVNYINLSLFVLSKRKREIGIRKINGARSKEILRQFSIESASLLLISFISAIILAEVLLPHVETLMPQKIYTSLYERWEILIYFISLFTLLQVFTGILPSYGFSKLNALSSLRDSSKQKGSKAYLLQNSLILLQFLISLSLIVSTLFIAKQLRYLQEVDLGFNQKNILTCSVHGNDKKMDLFASELKRLPEVKSFSFATGAPIAGSNLGMSYVSPYDKAQEHQDVSFKCVDRNFLETFRLEMLVGDWVKDEIKGDSLKPFVVNETFIRKFNFPKLEESLGMAINVGGNWGRICGVVKDFHSSSLHKKKEPMVLVNYTSLFFSANIEFHSKISQENIKTIEKIWKNIYPDYFWKHNTVDAYIEGLYKNDQRTYKLLLIFSGIAIFIAILGLIGVTSYSIKQKTKSICIRKIQGASIQNLLFNLSSKYLYIILFANLLSIPISYLYIDNWLNNFAYRIEIGFSVYLLISALSLFLGFLLISIATFKTVRKNPAETLRYE